MKSTSIFNSALFNYLRYVFDIIIFLILTPFVIHNLGLSDYGLWALILSTFGLYELLDFGLRAATIKYVSEFQALKQFDQRNKILSTIFATYLIIALLGFLSVVLLSLFFNSFFDLQGEEAYKAISLLFIFAFRTIILGIPLSIFYGVLFGLRHIPLINIISIGVNFVYALSVWWFLSQGHGVITLGVLNGLQFVLTYGLCAIPCFVILKDLKLSWKLVDFTQLRKVFSFSMMIFVANTSSLIILKADPIIIQSFLSLAFVTIYAIPLRITSLCTRFVQEFCSVLAPAISTLHAKKQNDELRQFIMCSMKYAIALSVLVTVTGMLFSHDFLLLWVGEEFVGSSTILIILLVSLLVNTPQLVLAKSLGLVGEHKFVTKVFGIAAVTNILASVSLIQSFGITGVAFGTLMSAVVMNAILIPKAAKQFSFSMTELFKNCIQPSITPAVALWIFTLVLTKAVEVTTVPIMVLVAIPGVVSYLIIFRFYSMKKEEIILFQ